ncbi:MAG: sensor histidine kinase [Lachnospiraceae bacterium]
MGELFFRIILYLLDGTFWILAPMWVLTKFYGYPAKPSKHRKWIFVIALVLYDILNLFIYYICLKTGSYPGVINGVLLWFCLGYWMVNLKVTGKWKRLLLIFFTMEFCVSIFDLVSCVFSYISLLTKGNIFVPVLIVYIQLIFEIGLFWLLSRLSSRNRKEPMGFSLAVSSVIMCILLDLVLDFFNVEGYSELQPIIRLRLTLPEEQMDRAMSIGVLLIIVVVVLLFIFMIIRESESEYFQKKNTINEYYLEIQKQHYESLMESNREIRKIKHDMKNHIYCLQMFCQNGEYENLETYLQEISDNLQHVDQSVHVGNEIADAIISEKKVKAEQKNIQLEVDGDMYGVNMSAIDVCTIFSNVIENALEAVEALPVENRKITLDIHRNQNFLLIDERNFIDHEVEIRDNTIDTTKKDKGNHGFGIMNIKEAAAKYDGECQLSVTSPQAGIYEFCIEIMIPIL